MYTVYCHINKLNNKKYVGITKQNINNRWRNGEGYKGQAFYNAIKKYGWEEFTHEILFTNLSRTEAEEKEKYLIKKWNTQNSKFGYNASSGGESGNGGAKCTEHRRKLMSERMKGGKNPMYGTKGGMCGKKLTKEQRNKISKGNKGKVRTPEMLKIMSKNASKPVYCSDGRTFASRKECAKELNCCVDSVIKHIKSGVPIKGVVIWT